MVDHSTTYSLSNFKVALKLKPNHSEDIFSIHSQSILIQNIASFSFDKIISQDSSNVAAFDFLKPSLSMCFKGVNFTILAYGDKSSGKTFTIFGSQSTPGLVQLILSHLFALPNRDSFTYTCSMVAVGHDRMADLLQENYENPLLKIKRDTRGSVYIENLAEIILEKEEDCLFLLKKGMKVRKSLKYNSDTVFQMTIESLFPDSRGMVSSAKINIVDVFYDKSSKNYQSLNSVLTCLTNNVSVPYRDSNLTKILVDTLNQSSNTTIFTTLKDISNSSLEILSATSSARQVSILPKKNENISTKFHSLKKLHNEILKLKGKLQLKKGGKTLSDEVNLMKIETERLKEFLNEEMSLEDVDELIKHNKFLRSQLEEIVGRPAADHDVELPDSVIVLQQALALTEDMIKKRKLVLADQEMKEKLRMQGRCTICTLKIPCKHVQISDRSPSPARRLSSAQDFFKSPSKDRPSTSGMSRRFVKKAEKKIQVLSKIEAYHEKKILKEIERVESEQKVLAEVERKKQKDESKRKKYLEINKEKLKEYKAMKEKRAVSERRILKKVKVKERVVVGIPNYEEKRKSISDILKQQSRYFRKNHIRANSMSYNESSNSYYPIKINNINS